MPVPTPTNEAYQALVEQLSALNTKLYKFINGTSTDSVATDAGPVKTIAGIVKDLTAFHYVQRVTDFKLYQQAYDALPTFEEGMLFRIWGDTVGINGLYEKQVVNGLAALVKVSYSDLYDLRDIFPPPWNYLNFQFDKTALDNGGGSIAERQISFSSTGYTETFRVEIELHSTKAGYRGVNKRVIEFALNTGNSTEIANTQTVVSNTTAALDSGFTGLTLPVLLVSDAPDTVYHNVKVMVSMPSIQDSMLIKVRVLGPTGKVRA